MKNTLAAVAVAVLLVLGASAPAQRPFNGIITFAVDVQAGQQLMAVSALLPRTIELAYLKKQVLFKLAIMGQDMEIILDGKRKEIRYVDHIRKKVLLMDADALNQLARSAQAQNPLASIGQELPQFQRGTATQTIAGFSCTEHTVSMTTETGTMTATVFTTPQIVPGFSAAQMGGGGMLGILNAAEMGGFPLQLQITVPGGLGSIKLTATQVVATAPAKARFKKPKGYTVEQQENLNLMNTGAGGGSN